MTIYTAFQEAFQEDFKYSDFFRDHLLRPQHIGDVRREFIYCGLETGLEKAVLIQVIYDQHNKSFKTEVQKSRTLLNLIHTFSIHFSIL